MFSVSIRPRHFSPHETENHVAMPDQRGKSTMCSLSQLRLSTELMSGRCRHAVHVCLQQQSLPPPCLLYSTVYGVHCIAGRCNACIAERKVHASNLYMHLAAAVETCKAVYFVGKKRKREAAAGNLCWLCTGGMSNQNSQIQSLSRISVDKIGMMDDTASWSSAHRSLQQSTEQKKQQGMHVSFSAGLMPSVLGARSNNRIRRNTPSQGGVGRRISHSRGLPAWPWPGKSSRGWLPTNQTAIAGQASNWARLHCLSLLPAPEAASCWAPGEWVPAFAAALASAALVARQDERGHIQNETRGRFANIRIAIQCRGLHAKWFGAVCNYSDRDCYSRSKWGVYLEKHEG